MPCIGGPSYDQVQEEILQKQAERECQQVEKAMLCAALSYIDDLKGDFEDFIKSTLWEEHGIKSNSVRNWWTNHCEQDELKKKQEELAKEKELIIKQALSKLSAKEIKALGIKKK